MRQLSRREKIILWIAVGTIFVYFTLAFIIFPLSAKAETLDKEMLKYRRIFRKNTAILARVEQQQKKWEELITPFQQKKSDEEETSELLSQMETLANQTGLRVLEMKPQKVRQTEFCRFFTVGLSFEGTLPQITNLLYAVQSPAYGLGIDTLILESDLSRHDTLNCGIEVSRLVIREETGSRDNNPSSP